MKVKKEIGSEYHKMPIEDGNGITYSFSPTYTLSGRTAIETVLNQLSVRKKAILPSYCCESMIIPFRNAGYEVVFYNVTYRDKLIIEMDIPDDADVILWCNYFGYEIRMPDLSTFINRGGIIIEDITHSLLSAHQYHSLSDYVVASLRKWEPINCGGICAGIRENILNVPSKPPSDEFISIREKAMSLKTAYLKYPEEEKKTEFLSLYAKANKWIEENYSQVSIDIDSRNFLKHINVTEQREKRRHNAEVLYRGLSDIVKFMLPVESMDCPLFVPILLPNRRDEIRRMLIEEKIYCPIHWPRPEGCESSLYQTELSLICDQRYNESDMNRIVDTIRKFL